VLFDPFLRIDPAIWAPNDAVTWRSTGDAAVLASAPQGTSALVANRMLATATWTITARFVSREQWGDGDRFGVVLFSALSGAELGECIVTCSAGVCAVANDFAGQSSFTQTIAPTPILRMQVAIVPFDAGTYYFECFTDGGASPGNLMFSSPAEPSYPALAAAPDVGVASIDILQAQ